MVSFLVAAVMAAPGPVVWHDDYDAATQLALKSKKDLLIQFHSKGKMTKVLKSPQLQKALGKYVCMRVPVKYEYEGKQLLDYPALKEMMGRPGLAIVSLKNPKSDNHREVISVHPLVSSRYSWAPSYGVKEVKTILSLPDGTLSQRTMIYAIRVHPERPQSVYSKCHPAFLAHAERHSRRQARMMNQHHADIIAAGRRMSAEGGIPVGSTSEVVAESWGNFVGGENVLEAAFSCVDAWRHSPGHWGAVSRRHTYYGYDIAKGPNGTWYATGIFAD